MAALCSQQTLKTQGVTITLCVFLFWFIKSPLVRQILKLQLHCTDGLRYSFLYTKKKRKKIKACCTHFFYAFPYKHLV